MVKDKTVTIRLPLETFKNLEAVVVKRRKKTGEAITRTEVIREALDEYLKEK